MQPPYAREFPDCAKFQSSPARGGGCNVGNHKLELPKRPSVVSILTRPWGRVQPGAWRAACRLCQSRFNPHPPVGAGATPTHSRMRGGYHRFQSSPARGGGCNATGVCRSRRATSGFNPRPPVGAGATVLKRVVELPTMIVSILTRPWGRVQPTRSDAHTHRCPVSILTRPWGRVQLSIRMATMSAGANFLGYSAL